MVFEDAGKKGEFKNAQGRAFARNLGPQPRLLVKTWKQEKGVTRAHGAVKKAVRLIEPKINEVVR
jgi:hypothetical protein